MSNILIICQARCESIRLPNKVLMPLCGQPMLLWLLNRLASLPYQIVVAVPHTSDNKQIAELCATHGYACHMVDGDPDNVLNRFAQVAMLYPDAQHIVRVGGDTPLLDPAVAEGLLTYHLRHTWRRDYTGLAKEWGDGSDTEVFTRDTLFTTHAEALAPHELEHVSSYIWGHPQRFRLAHYPCPFDVSDMRYSVDTKDDLLHVQSILEHCLIKYGFDFGWREIWWTVEQDATLRAYMQHRPINEAYLTQVGSRKSWEELRYGKVSDNA